MKKAALHNLGCKVNAYETEAMQELLEKNGYEIVPFHDLADVYVINTCSVTNMADRKSRQMIHRARKQNPDAVIVAAGCYVQAQADMGELDENIDIVIGNNKKKDLDVYKRQGYDIAKKKLIDNTEAFVKGKKANNCLLFGDAGTGKSSSIKAILNQYYDQGLRMIEVYKHQFKDLNDCLLYTSRCV